VRTNSEIQRVFYFFRLYETGLLLFHSDVGFKNQSTNLAVVIVCLVMITTVNKIAAIQMRIAQCV